MRPSKRIPTVTFLYFLFSRSCDPYSEIERSAVQYGRVGAQYSYNIILCPYNIVRCVQPRQPCDHSVSRCRRICHACLTYVHSFQGERYIYLYLGTYRHARFVGFCNGRLDPLSSSLAQSHRSCSLQTISQTRARAMCVYNNDIVSQVYRYTAECFSFVYHILFDQLDNIHTHIILIYTQPYRIFIIYYYTYIYKYVHVCTYVYCLCVYT